MPALFFAYGTLAPAEPGGAVRDGWMPDMVRGRLFDLGPYPALVDVDDPAAGWVKGYVRVIDTAVLTGPLDRYEGVAEGLFCRVIVTTRAGHRAWVYLYAQPLPPAARGPLVQWDGPRAGLDLRACRSSRKGASALESTPPQEPAPRREGDHA